MLKKREPSLNKDVEPWVRKIASDPSTPVQSVERVTPKHLRLGMRNAVSGYNMDIKDQGLQISYGAILTPDIEGSNQAACYGDILELNAKLNNGIRVGRENGNLTVTKEDHKEGLGPLAVGRSIRNMDDSLQVLLPEVHKIVKNNNGHFKRGK